MCSQQIARPAFHPGPLLASVIAMMKYRDYYSDLSNLVIMSAFSHPYEKYSYENITCTCNYVMLKIMSIYC